MLRELKLVDVIEFGLYTVTLQKLKNCQDGCPKYEATIIYTGQDRMMNRVGYRYRFKGHYYNERQEAEWILEQHLKEDK